MTSCHYDGRGNVKSWVSAVQILRSANNGLLLAEFTICYVDLCGHPNDSKHIYPSSSLFIIYFPIKRIVQLDMKVQT